jgi:hypothetical protein
VYDMGRVERDMVYVYIMMTGHLHYVFCHYIVHQQMCVAGLLKLKYSFSLFSSLYITLISRIYLYLHSYFLDPSSAIQGLNIKLVIIKIWMQIASMSNSNKTSYKATQYKQCNK